MNSDDKNQSKTFITLTALGFLSGIITAVLMTGDKSFPGSSKIYNILPGILYGVALALFFFSTKQQKSWYKIFIFIAISAVAYNTAFFVTIFTPLYVNPSPLKAPIDPTLFFSGGIAGALILSLGLKFLLSPLKWSRVSILTILGGLLGMFGWMAGSLFTTANTTGSAGLPSANLYSLYIIWQTGIALAIAFFI